VALASLATTGDLTVRTIAFDDEVLAETYLSTASAAIRDAARCAIGSVTSTVDLWPADGDSFLRLPGGPVTAVTSVVLDGATLTQGLDYVLRDGALWRPGCWASCAALPTPVVATYTHGLPEVPEDIVDLVCRMTASALVAASASDDGSGLATGNVMSERLGDYYVMYNSAAGVTEMELSPRTYERLRARFGGGAAMVPTR
jgi:hypothetical protein